MCVLHNVGVCNNSKIFAYISSLLKKKKCLEKSIEARNEVQHTTVQHTLTRNVCNLFIH